VVDQVDRLDLVREDVSRQQLNILSLLVAQVAAKKKTTLAAVVAVLAVSERM
jgi:hypothetical protein